MAFTDASTAVSAAADVVDRLAHPTGADLAAVDAWWRANNYLTVGQIYLMANPLLREPLASEQIKPRLLGHWGTSPGLALVYASRLIQHTGQQMIYPGAIHQLVHGRPDPDRFHVRGFVEEGTTTTAFDMVVRNRASRNHLVIAALERARRTPAGASELKAWCEQQLLRHERYVVEHLEDMPEVRDWSLGDWAEQG